MAASPDLTFAAVEARAKEVLHITVGLGLLGVTLGLNLGTPSPGQPPDRTILQLEYRFLPQWRVRTTNGDKGSSILDFLWQYRY